VGPSSAEEALVLRTIVFLLHSSHDIVDANTTLL